MHIIIRSEAGEAVFLVWVRPGYRVGSTLFRGRLHRRFFLRRLLEGLAIAGRVSLGVPVIHQLLGLVGLNVVLELAFGEFVSPNLKSTTSELRIKYKMEEIRLTLR